MALRIQLDQYYQAFPAKSRVKGRLEGRNFTEKCSACQISPKVHAENSVKHIRTIQ